MKLQPTFAYLSESGTWGVRVPHGIKSREGTCILVHRKDGTSSSELLGRMLRSDKGAKVYAINREPQRQLSLFNRCTKRLGTLVPRDY
jgi:hypothetical protein